MKIYYAHCQAIYDTPQEKRDIETLEKLRFEVVNPNGPIHQDTARRLKEKDPNSVMDYFYKLVAQCDAIAFRALPDGAIPAGIGGEIANLGIPVIELPSGIKRRVLTVEQTREYLKEVGQR